MKGSSTTHSSKFFFIGAFIVAFFIHGSASAQLKNVKGKVSDVSKIGIAGATIQVQGTQRYTVTDAKGDFTIQSASAKEVLVVSYTGFVTQNVPIGTNIVINVTLREDSKLLNDVVVIGYGSVKKSDVTGAITSIKPDPNDASKSLSVENLLQGKVAGVSVSSSVAAPGAANSVTIRGANSLRGDNQPLYIIDNIPQASTGAFPPSALGGGRLPDSSESLNQFKSF